MHTNAQDTNDLVNTTISGTFVQLYASMYAGLSGRGDDARPLCWSPPGDGPAIAKVRR